MNDLKIEYVDISTLKPCHENAKIHTTQQIEQIKKSILKFGMNDPIAVWKDNLIIEGHGRYEACKLLAFDKVPVIRLDELTEQQRQAYSLIHNKLTMNTGFDLDILRAELASIEETNMSDFGFDLQEAATYFDEDKPEKADDLKKCTFVVYLSKDRLQELKNVLDEQGWKYKV